MKLLNGFFFFFRNSSLIGRIVEMFGVVNGDASLVFLGFVRFFSEKSRNWDGIFSEFREVSWKVYGKNEKY